MTTYPEPEWLAAQKPAVRERNEKDIHLRVLFCPAMWFMPVCGNVSPRHEKGKANAYRISAAR